MSQKSERMPVSSSSVKTLNCSADCSSLTSSSTLVGIDITPPKTVRWFVRHVSPPVSRSTAETARPPAAQSPALVSQYRQLAERVQLASMKPKLQTQSPLEHLPLP